MLVMLVGVTTILLLVMGTVSTYLLARRVDEQVAASTSRLTSTADRLARNPASDFGGYAVVEIPVAPHLKVRQLTSGELSNDLATIVSTWLAGRSSARVRALAQQGTLVKAALADCRQFPYIGCQPFDVDPKVEVASSWAPDGRNAAVKATGPAIFILGQPVSSDPGQVRGFIIAEVITGAALIALLALAGEWLIGRGLEPLNEMARTANDITSRGDLTARMTDVNEQTEVGKLGTSINTMLDRIQQAFNSRLRSEQKVREFAADASHELRTPLTTIRGYAELYRQGALGPDELPNAMRRIEQEAQRMSTLVAELLELARLDRTSSLDLAESDLASVVRDAVADAVAVEPERPVRAEAPPRLVAVVDEPRIRQVLANLLGNVRAHTPLTTPVAVRLGQITGGVLIEVADAGPGMSAEDAIRAFDRFHRAQSGVSAGSGGDWPAHAADANGGGANDRASNDREPAAVTEVNGTGRHRQARGGTAASNGNGNGHAPYGARGAHPAPGVATRAGDERTGGSGLGLSIVQAIANAHGGRATLESWPGYGTKVRVWLPVRIVPETQ
jgi:signal transduction histidine kinase